MTVLDLLRWTVPDELVGISFVLFGAVFLLWGADLIRDSYAAVDRRWPPPRTFQWHLGAMLVGFWSPFCWVIAHNILAWPSGISVGWVAVVVFWKYLVLRAYVSLVFYRDETQIADAATEIAGSDQ